MQRGSNWARGAPDDPAEIALLVGDKLRSHALRRQLLRLHFHRQCFGLPMRFD
jgi:hypothetical protein